MLPSALIIGDTHFKSSNKGTTYSDFIDFINKITEIAKKKKPSFIVLLGDILDSHDIKIPAHKLASLLISNLSSIAPTYILIGNHDYINNSQFLTDNHIFTPFKKWKNVYVADTEPLVLNWAPPLYHKGGKGKESSFETSEENTKTFIFCPYVPPGRFIEALDKVTLMGHNWDLVDCIFAHQEFKGCTLGGSTISTKGDVWDEDYPIVISGHIHEEATIGENIFYVGSSTQVNFAESPDKKVWFVTWNEDDFDIDKISVGVRQKREMIMTTENLLKKESCKKFMADLKKYALKIVIYGKSEEIKMCRKSRFVQSLKSEYGVNVEYNLEDEEMEELGVACNSEAPIAKSSSYRKIFHKSVKGLTDEAKLEYEILFGRASIETSDEEVEYDESAGIELVFEEV